jgi:hypothetical protein
MQLSSLYLTWFKSLVKWFQTAAMNKAVGFFIRPTFIFANLRGSQFKVATRLTKVVAGGYERQCHVPNTLPQAARWEFGRVRAHGQEQRAYSAVADFRPSIQTEVLQGL